MNSQKAGLRVAGFIFGLVCLVHIWRLIAHFDVHFGQYSVPIWVSGLGAIVTGVLSIWLWMLSNK